MSEIKDGGPAFPSHGTMGEVNYQGMSLRDWFAGMAMQGLLAAPVGKVVDPARANETDIAREAFILAEAMIAEMTKRGKL